MKVKQETWTIKTLVKNQPNVNLNPSWQRGSAWQLPRQALLIDSILRGMDIPKVYLRKLPQGNPHSHDAVDGQQRIRAIWEFRAGVFALTHPEPLPQIDGLDVAGKKFSALDQKLKNRFENFEVSIAEITSATNDEITNLFSRLQMGVSLNPAELRNAILGPMRHVIDVMATSHDFFQTSRIADVRHKRQDFVTHAFAMAAYQGAKDVKAPDLKRMVTEFDVSRTDEVLDLSSAVGDALTILAAVEKNLSRKITQKWIFVDLCWLIMQQQSASESINANELAESFKAFETLRREYLKHPEDLIRVTDVAPKQNRLNRHLYDYIMAFRAQGGTHANLRVRNTALRAFCR